MVSCMIPARPLTNPGILSIVLNSLVPKGSSTTITFVHSIRAKTGRQNTYTIVRTGSGKIRVNL